MKTNTYGKPETHSYTFIRPETFEIKNLMQTFMLIWTVMVNDIT